MRGSFASLIRFAEALRVSEALFEVSTYSIKPGVAADLGKGLRVSMDFVAFENGLDADSEANSWRRNLRLMARFLQAHLLAAMMLISSVHAEALRDPFQPPDIDDSAESSLPLQSFRLSEFRLVAISRSLVGRYALVEGPDGRGYILSVGK